MKLGPRQKNIVINLSYEKTTISRNIYEPVNNNDFEIYEKIHNEELYYFYEKPDIGIYSHTQDKND